MKVAVIVAISLVVTCQAFSVSNRHHTKKHHHQVRDGETTPSETLPISSTQTTTDIHIYFDPESVCLCENVCPQPSTNTDVVTTDTIEETTKTSQKRRHLFHYKKNFNAHNKKHHSVRNSEGLNKKYWNCNCNNCVTLNHTTTGETETTTSQEAIVTEAITVPNAKKHHNARAHHVKHHFSKKNHH